MRRVRRDPRLGRMISPIRRTLVAVSLAALTLGSAAACSSEGAKTDCSINACTVTFDRGVDANASVLGIKAELVNVQGNNVTLKVGGQSVTVPVNGSQDAGGMTVSVQSVSKDNVVVKIARN